MSVHYKIIEYPDDVDMVVVSGDIHGEFGTIINKVIAQYSITNALVIVAGDCGFGFERPGYYENILNKYRRRLSAANVYFAFMRGNHDNPHYFKEGIIDWKRFMTIEDYTVIKAAGHNILCIGGAISIDRYDRYGVRLNSARFWDGAPELMPGVYWPGEKVVLDKKALKDIIINEPVIDTVVTHTAPSFCEFTQKNGLVRAFQRDEELEDDVNEERLTMDMIHKALVDNGRRPKNWIYGHFHASWHSTIEDTTYTMLDIEELKELRNYVDSEESQENAPK